TRLGRAARRYARTRSARNAVVCERRRDGERARCPGSDAGNGRSSRPPAYRVATAPRLSVLLLLPQPPARAAVADGATRCAEHARLTAAALSRPRACQLGHPAGRAADWRDTALHG